MNNVALVGRLTRDPEMRQTQSGISVCRFTVAVNRRYKNAQGQYEADFISCQAWRQTAEFINKYFNKGKEISLTGSLQTGSYDKDGVKHYTTDVIVENVEFVGSKGDDKGNDAVQSALRTTTPQAYSEMTPADDDDDLPF